MKRIMLVLGILLTGAFLVGAASGFEVSNLRAPGNIAAAAANDSVIVSSATPQGLPGGIIACTGSGDRFSIAFWGDYDDDGYFEWSDALSIPGALTLPRSQAENRSGTYYVGWKFTCATDSVSYVVTD